MAKRISKSAALIGLFALCGGLAACNPEKDLAGPPVINGQWASADGVFTANFLNGSFQATANDTGNVISRGEYIVLSDTQLQLKWDGLVSGKSNQANCNRPSETQMDCVDAEGRTFSLVRKV